MSLTQIFLSEDTDEPFFYVEKRGMKIPVKIKENKGSWCNYGALDRNVKDRIERWKPPEATHVWTFEMITHVKPLYYVVQYFTIP